MDRELDENRGSEFVEPVIVLEIVYYLQSRFFIVAKISDISSTIVRSKISLIGKGL